MADHLARIFGTEEDKVNCPFYYKIGACRHGERCSRNHMKPNFSQTLIIPHMYTAPPLGPDGQPMDDKERFEDFYEEIMEELGKYGYIEQLHVVENLGEHMYGNVYVKYSTEEEAEACMKALHGRYYAGRMLMPEYSPVTDFREARCRQFDEEHCGRGGYCNFMHLKRPTHELKKLLKKFNKKWKKKSASRSRSRDRDRKRHRSKSRSRSRGRGDRDRDRDRDRRRSRSRSRSRSRGRGDRDRDRSSSKKEEFPRGSSAERRAMIAQWKKNKDAAAAAPPSGGGDSSAQPPAAAPSNP